MEHFFIDVAPGQLQGQEAFWVVPSSSTLSGTAQGAQPLGSGRIFRAQSRSGSATGTEAVSSLRDTSGCQVLVRPGNHQLTSSNGAGQLHPSEAREAFVEVQPRLKPVMTYRRRRSDGVRLSIAMAAHNEHKTIAAAISQVLSVELPCELELIVIDDGSTDGTLEIVQSFDDSRLTVLVHSVCQGKGASILDAAAVATGTHLLVFDADLEYSAADIPSLVQPVLDNSSSVVYGTRIRGSRGLLNSLVYGAGSKMTTVFTNLIFRSQLRDMHTCLKLIPISLFKQLTLSNAGFGLDTEISCELLRRKITPQEVSCSYHARSVAQGKQISLQDGLECLRIVLQVRMRRRVRRKAEFRESLTIQLGQ